jgi:hypothetical protein
MTTATLEHARPVATPGVEDGEFVEYGYRPIFKEHINSRDFDEPVRFGREAMQRIADRSNRRIQETGDYCPIVVRHTDKGDGTEVIGFLGPYEARKMPSGKWAVYAKERIYKEDAHKRKRYPRLSVEYWGAKSDPTDGYFDPACLLGGETPELDLGVHYAADQNDPTKVHYRRVIRYEAAMPGGSNTCVPSGTAEKKAKYEEDEEPARYQGGALNPADVQQITAALKPIIDQAVAEAVGKMQAAGADPQGQLGNPEADEGMTPELEGAEGLGAEGLGADDSQFAGDDADFDATAGDAEAAAGPDEEGDDDSGIDEGSDLDEEPEIDDSLPESDEKPSDEAKPKKKKQPPAKYAATGEHSTVPFEESDMATETVDQQVVRYQRESADYKKQRDDAVKDRDDYKAKYQKAIDAKRDADDKLVKFEERLATIEASERRAVRYQKLSDLQNKGFTLDVEEELKDCDEMTAPQFDKHVERIASKYQRVPLPGVNMDRIKVDGSRRVDQSQAIAQKKEERYSKLAADNVQRARYEKKSLDFDGEFRRLMTEDPEKIGSSAV